MTRFSRSLLGSAALAAVLMPSCGGGGGGGGGAPGPTDSFDRQALLTNLAVNLAVPAYQELLVRVQALQTAVQEHAADVADAAKRDAARQAWREAMNAAQVVELLRFGPAGSSLDIAGGMDIGIRIYSWPLENPCRVDEETVDNQFESPGFFDTELVNVSGLDAIEYLLFDEDGDNACGDVPINQGSPTPWESLGAAEVAQRRADYAAAACVDLVSRVQQLVTAWDPAGSNFLATISAAASSGTYASAHAAVNDVFAAMFYLDTVIKDKKLAEPAGLTGGPVDPTLVESSFASVSKENILRNLETFQVMFLGNAPADPAAIGFDDFLVARGAGSLATTMAADIASAIAAVQAIPGTLEEALISDLAAVQAAHAAIKAITDNMKSQFVTVLNLSVPQTGAGDND
jgi:predicted lipoprotein